MQACLVGSGGALVGSKLCAPHLGVALSDRRIVQARVESTVENLGDGFGRSLRRVEPMPDDEIKSGQADLGESWTSGIALTRVTDVTP
jgi:hypothetical protein